MPPCTSPCLPLTETRVALEYAADLLVQRGYFEAITYSFVDPALQARFCPGETSLELRNPISAELAVMRLSLWPGLVQALRENQRRQQPRVQLFELGRSFSAEHGNKGEKPNWSRAWLQVHAFPNRGGKSRLQPSISTM